MDCIRYIKIILSVLSASILTIIVAVFSEKIPLGVIITSLACLYIVCGIVIFDNSSIIKLLKIQVDRLNVENIRLNKLNNTLSINVNALNDENVNYKNLNAQQTKTLEKFSSQIIENKNLLDVSKKQVEDFRALLIKSNEMNEMNNRLIISQKDNIDKLNQQLNIAVANNNNLSAQVQKFETLNNGLKTIITTMAKAIDQSSNLEIELNKSINKVQEVSNDIQKTALLMNKIINGLSHMKFDQFDLDNNGEISKSEWQKIVFLENYEPYN